MFVSRTTPAQHEPDYSITIVFPCQTQQASPLKKGVSFLNFEKRSFIVSKIGFCNGKLRLVWTVGEWNEE